MRPEWEADVQETDVSGPESVDKLPSSVSLLILHLFTQR